MRLATRLKEVGFGGTPEEFRHLVVDLFRTLFPPETSDENILLHPSTKAVRLVEAVRAEVGRPLPEDLVLGTLVNTRKHQQREGATN